jgi:DNA-binding CsgD family transcriptional regulator
MASRQDRPTLLGRQNECRTLEQLLISVKAGQSRALVLRGEAGVGKSALLDFVTSQASEFRVVRIAGVESEAELAFSGVHQLCAPMMGGMSRLPTPQREALATAFGVGTGEAPDRFMVGLAVLGLLAETSTQRPLLCLVDDADWLDRESSRILAFVARRLLAERLGLLFVVREPSEGRDFQDLPELRVLALGEVDSRALLSSTVPGRMDAHILDRILTEARGNPLALLELPRDLAAADLAGGYALPGSTPLSGRIEQSYLQRLRSLPADTQRLLLAASAEPLGDVQLLWRAAARLGIGFDAAHPAVQDGFVEFASRVRFRHPLVRSAIYGAAAVEDRQLVHQALAEATDPDSDPDRRAWHRARAATGPHEEVAGELERSAERARSRGGASAAAAFLERSTELTADPVLRGVRALVAANAKFEAGLPEAASRLLAVAELSPLTELQLAQVARLRARMSFAERRGSDAPPILLSAARRLSAVDTSAAADAYFEALEAAVFTGRLGGANDVAEVAQAARSALCGVHSPGPMDALLDGLATLLSDGHATGLIALQRAVRQFAAAPLHNQREIMRWLSLAPIAQEAAAHHLWDYQLWRRMADRAARLARDAGALGTLPVALMYSAGVHLHDGDLRGASVLIEEADAITAATHNAPVSYASMALVAWLGEEGVALDMMESRVRDATVRGEGTVLALAGYATALLYNGLCRFDAALAGARRGCDSEDFSFFAWTLPELIEAAARTGAHDLAVSALQKFEERARAAGTPWALGMLSRSRALLSEGDTAESSYRDALSQLEQGGVAVHLARAHLIYGEWLRRDGRRVEAREQLRKAHEQLSRFGAGAFAERAERELLATGEAVRKRSEQPRNDLTSQEAQVARLAAEGHTNQEIGSQLFISHRTAEYHLHKVFVKLNISSRRELRHALGIPSRRASTWTNP